MLRHLLVDLDGVIRTWDPLHDAAVEDRYGLPVGSIAAAAFGDQATLHAAVTGRITDGVWRSKVAERLSSFCGEAAAQAVADWSLPVGAVDPEVLGCLQRARRAGWRIGLLTNATTRLRADLSRLGLDGEFDAVVSSADLGVAKPDVVAFEQACARLCIGDPGRCVFVDDAAVNVQGAILAGLDAHVFAGAEWLTDLLGVPPRSS